MSPQIRAIFYLILAAAIWGINYPVGRAALDIVSPTALNGFRYLFGALALLPLAWRWRRRPSLDNYSGSNDPLLWLKGGALGGLLLTTYSVIQLSGLAHTTASKAGFLGTLYLSLVPVLAFVSGHMPRALVWVGLAVGVFGLYFMTGGDAADGGFNSSEGLIIASCVFAALQVLVTGRYAMTVNVWLFTFAQALVCSISSLFLAFIFGELPSWEEFWQVLPAISYGILSVGVAFICQMVAQRYTSSSSAALILPLQAVFAAVAGVIFLGEQTSTAMIWGSIILLSGSLIAQFAKEPIQLTRENSPKVISILRIFTGVFIVVGTISLLIWGYS